MRIEINTYPNGSAFCPALVMFAGSREQIKRAVKKWFRRRKVEIVWRRMP